MGMTQERVTADVKAFICKGVGEFSASVKLLLHTGICWTGLKYMNPEIKFT